MTVVELKKEIAALEPDVQDELVAYIVHLKHERDPEYTRVLERRLNDRNPENWVRLEDVEREFGYRRETEG